MKNLFTLFISLFFLGQAWAQTQKNALEIKHLTDNFYIFTTYQSYKGMTVPANGMYLVTPEGVLLFDMPWDTTQFQPLLDSLQAKHQKGVIFCIATHSHSDRTAGLEFYRQKGAKTFTSRQTDSISQKTQEKRAEFLFNKDTAFSIDSYSFETYYAGAGHTSDNIVIWFEKEKILYGGCLIKSTEAQDLGNLGDARVNEWPETLKRIQRKFKKRKYVIPGHQSWKDRRSLEHTLKMAEEYLKRKK
jgi:metallo-beta-lactamase class B